MVFESAIFLRHTVCIEGHLMILKDLRGKSQTYDKKTISICGPAGTKLIFTNFD